MNKRAKLRVLRRATYRYFKSRGLHKNKEDIKQDIKSVNGAIAQLESKRDKIKDFYGVGYKIIHAQIQGLRLLEKSLEDKLVEKRQLRIPLSFLRDIINDSDIKTEGMVIILVKTYLNIAEGEDVIVACKDSLSRELSRNGMSHRGADETASNIVNLHFGGDSIINTRKNKENKYQKAVRGGYLRNQSRPIIDNKEDG